MATFEQDMGEFGENVTLRITGTFEDDTGVVIPGPSLGTVTLTIYDVRTGGIATGFDHLDIIAFVDVTGALSYKIAPAGSLLLSPNRLSEDKVALVEWTYNLTDKGYFRYLFTVVNEALR